MSVPQATRRRPPEDVAASRRHDVDLPDDATLDARFAEAISLVAASAVEREQARRLAHDEVGALRAAGFTRLRVPREHGGLGASLPQTVRQLERLAEADPNLVQALRAHFSTVDSLLASPPGDHRERWLRRLGEGVVVGNATTERGNAAGGYATRLREVGGRLRLDGTKFYGTGSLYADWVLVAAEDHRPAARGRVVRVAVPVGTPGLELVDDWDGFGQRLTASGTTHLRDVTVSAEEVLPWRDPTGPSAHPAYVQVVLLAALSGIARAVRRDAVDYVLARTRTFDHATHAVPARDPQVQEVVGRLSSRSYAVSATLRSVTGTLASALDAAAAGTLDADHAAELDAQVAEAQVFIVEAVLQSATQLFEVGGASAVGAGRALDRHWRNARVLGQHNPVVYRARAAGQQRLTGDQVTTAITVGSRPLQEDS